MTKISETIARFEHGGDTYEIDHLGIGRDSQWGEFAIYSHDIQVGSFAIPEALLKAEYRPAELPVAEADLIRLANEALDAA
jgi:hypothetical protein